LIVGLDGATFDLIRPWAAEGRLPTFQRLMGESAWGELNVDLPPGTVPNWPFFATGKNPGKHGLIWWVKRDPTGNDFSVASSGDLRGQTLRDIAGQNGRQVVVVNVPVTYPPPTR
jgi:predicted AlkP superfamily phosphohydrolase/phosphomutase